VLNFDRELLCEMRVLLVTVASVISASRDGGLVAIEVTYGFVVIGKVQVAGISPSGHYQLSVVVHRHGSEERVHVFKDERRNGLCFQLAGRPRTTVDL